MMLIFMLVFYILNFPTMANSEFTTNTTISNFDRLADLINHQFMGLRKEFNIKFDSIDDKFSKIDDKFSKIDDKFSKIDEKFSKIDENF